MRAARRNQSRVQGKGWEIVDPAEDRYRTRLTFRPDVPTNRWGWLTPASWLGVLLALALVAAMAVVVVDNGPQWRARYEAWAAARSLKSGDLGGVEKRLADNRGNADFAYFFTSKATPRALGDALATVAGKNEDEPLKPSVDPHEYELTLTDLAGTLALATHGTGDRSLDESWTKDFVTATTDPSDLYKVDGGIGDKIPFHKTDAEKRRDQDTANKSNLLLLLARGYWSTEFLQAVTSKYYDFDRKEGDDAWPDAEPDDDVGYAAAPSGTYLTDGILAVTAALSANSAASEWAFTEFQPKTVEIDDSDYRVGTFTNYLMFEHEFPESGGESIGMTAALTALSSAVDPESRLAVTDAELPEKAASKDAGPMHDIIVLRALAHQLNEKDPCSWWVLNCIDNAASTVWHWVKRWGHLVLDILTVATSFAPPPFDLIAVAPATLNATWYSIEGDYRSAGLSLAAVVPGLGFSKIASAARSKKLGRPAATAVKKADEIAKVAKRWRPMRLNPWKDCDLVPPGGLRLSYDKNWTRAQRKAADEKVKAYYDLAQQGKLVKTVSKRSGTAASKYRKATGKDAKPHQDVDHIQDLQLGGADDASNMKPLDKVVNASLGQQVAIRIRDLEIGTAILGAAIC